MNRRRFFQPLSVFGVLLILSMGCVSRSIIVKSEPPGARVIVDGVEKGITPCRFPFTYYGGRSIILEKEGYQTLEVIAWVKPPFFHVFPFDFLLIFMPSPMVDRHIFFYQLKLKEPVNFREVAKRGKDLKQYMEKNYHEWGVKTGFH